MKKIFIYYNNGLFESVDTINMTLIHMVEQGVIEIIVDTEEGKAWIRSRDGISEKVNVPSVGGLT